MPEAIELRTILIQPNAPKVSIVRDSVTNQSITNQVTEHLEYLKEVSTKGANPPITPETAALARKAWYAVWESTENALPIPAACTGPDGQMLYTWDRDRHHLELEIIPGQAAEFFYRDRTTGTLWGEDYVVGSELSAEAIQKLKLFL